ncbi:lysozyme-like domain-containing protein [Phialemonium atrogriseum]|uniref:Lysozyme-like domain-containing protein n=1 Tax=Phialemonium atrogriseum TaxID=1093897 RepID=A0AAJ0FCJ7_9PEZI|nr:lysozyme-like domain-containing protein [Phialemonium atrogriseum]KAK1762192.1 lysozyme-like domain-containing protein [Phialemonium atrogriseum]
MKSLPATLAILALRALAETTCTAPTGQTGLCIPASTCTDTGGASGPGTCPDDGDQCCTYGSCTIPGPGLTGLCQPNSTCATCAGGTSTGGYCAGGATIQCCTFGACVGAGGAPGQCVLDSTCGGGVLSTEAGGGCPGPENVRCCTYGACSSSGSGNGSGNGSSAGFCQTRSSCSGTSEAGLCPGPADVQCCTPGTGCEGGASLVNQATLELVQSFEGWFPDIYDDPDGNPTVGWGHLCADANCSDVPYPIPLSEQDGTALLQSDLKIAQRCITDDIDSSVVLNPNQYGALVSWAFNVGCGNSGTSTLVELLNQGGDPDEVARQELPQWNRGADDVLPGLVRRRAAEVGLFTTPADGVAHPPPC